MDFIYREIEAGVMCKRTPAYAPLIQKFVNHVAGETIMLCREIVKPDLFAPVFTKGPEIPKFAKGKGSLVGARASSSRAPVPPSAPAPGRKGGSAISRFF